MEAYVDELQSQNWFQRIMKSEGGVNWEEAESVGGKSCAGIGQLPYEDWLKKKCPKSLSDVPRQVEELIGTALGTEWEKASPFEIPSEYGVRIDVITAFYKDYFSLARLDVVPECLKYMHADFYVNSKFTANKLLQRMVGFSDDVPGEVDGILGPASRERISVMDQDVEPDDLILGYHEAKLAHYASIEKTNKAHYDKNIRGWRRRAQHVLSELEEWFYDEEPTTSALAGDEDDIDLFAEEHELLNGTESSPIGSLSEAEIIAALPNLPLELILTEFARRTGVAITISEVVPYERS